MAKLICTLDNRVIGEYALNKERITIGRRHNNDIVIDNLSVSGLHAFVITIGKDSFLEDANSTNGTLVNLKPIKKHVLDDKDVIEIGRHHFLYRQQHQETANETPSQAEVEQAGTTPLEQSPHTQPPSLKSVIQRSRQMKVDDHFLPETDAKAIPAAHNQVAKLHILSGTNSGQTLTLDKTLTTLGKSGTQLVVITKRPNGYFLTQIEGKAKPHINGTPLNALSYSLKHRDMVEMSDIKMEFSIE